MIICIKIVNNFSGGYDLSNPAAIFKYISAYYLCSKAYHDLLSVCPYETSISKTSP